MKLASIIKEVSRMDLKNRKMFAENLTKLCRYEDFFYAPSSVQLGGGGGDISFWFDTKEIMLGNTVMMLFRQYMLFQAKLFVK